ALVLPAPWTGASRPRCAGHVGSRTHSRRRLSWQGPHGVEHAHDRCPHLPGKRALVRIARTAFEPLVNVDADFQAVADVLAGLAHDLNRLLDLLVVLCLK